MKVNMKQSELKIMLTRVLENDNLKRGYSIEVAEAIDTWNSMYDGQHDMELDLGFAILEILSVLQENRENE